MSYSYDQLNDLFQRDIDRITDFKKIPADLISLKPNPDAWNTIEIIEHIRKFNNLYIKEIDKAVDINKPVASEKDQFKPRFVTRQFIRFLNPPYKIKTKTVAPMYPEDSNSKNPNNHIDQLSKTNHYLINKINDFKIEHLNLDQIKGNNPVIQWLSMTLTDFILVLEAHQRRHFWQIEQTLLKLSGKKY